MTFYGVQHFLQILLDQYFKKIANFQPEDIETD